MPIRVLVVEDDEAVAEALSMALEVEHEVMVARDGREAVAWIESARVDVIVLDLMMPVMDGEEVMEYLQAAGHTTPVIVASAGRDLERRCRDMGATDFLQKPYTLVELIEKIRRFAGGGSGGAAEPGSSSEPSSPVPSPSSSTASIPGSPLGARWIAARQESFSPSARSPSAALCLTRGDGSSAAARNRRAAASRSPRS